MTQPDVDVVIVGAGPTGLVASLLLEQQGISTRVIERRPHAQRAPAAHVVNARTFEICRAAGVDMNAIADAAMDPADAGYAYWVTKLGGRALGRSPFERQGGDQLDVTPTPLRNLSQNRFEPILLEALERIAKRVPDWSHSCLDCEDRGGYVVTRVRDDASGETSEISSRYVIGADGAGSRTRKELGIELVGPTALQSFIMVHFKAKLRGLADVPPGVLFFLCDPEATPGVFVIHDLDTEAVFMMPYDPQSEALEDYGEARCEAAIRGSLEEATLDFTVTNIGAWTMTAQVAQRYRDGRIFLAGDAAHRFPPTGGLGLNSGVQDAHNLAWKLAAVIKSDAAETLIDTYESERRPVAQSNADQSLSNALKLIEVPMALDLAEPGQTTSAELHAKLDDPELRKRLDIAITNQQEHFDMPGLQLGFCYENGAIIRGPDDAVPQIDIRRFSPTGVPGARLPHAWLVPRESGESLLDRVALDRFILLSGPDGKAWIDDCAAVGNPTVDALQLDESVIENLDTWLAAVGIERDGALLVRPDQHIAWRSRKLVDNPAERLTIILNTLLR